MLNQDQIMQLHATAVVFALLGGMFFSVGWWFARKSLDAVLSVIARAVRTRRRTGPAVNTFRTRRGTPPVPVVSMDSA